MGAVERFPEPDVLIPAAASVGEGPVVDHRTGRLCWVDIVEGQLYENDLTGECRTIARLGTMVGAVAPRQRAEGFAVAVAEGFGYWASEGLAIADPMLPEPHRRMNDAKCDARGHLWAGSTHMQFVPGAGALHRWDGGPSSVTVAAGFTLPNGLGWNQDGTIMYLIDSMNNSLLNAAFHADEGQVGEFSTLCKISPGLPDGLAVDMDGSIWVAVWSGGEVRRFDRHGELVGIIPMPVSQPTSCAFGADGTLYITSARRGLGPTDLVGQPHAGSVFALHTNTLGVPVSAFAA